MIPCCGAKKHSLILRLPSLLTNGYWRGIFLARLRQLWRRLWMQEAERDAEPQQQEWETAGCCWAWRWESNPIQTAVTASSQFSVESIINQARNWAFIPLPCNKVLFAEGTHSKMFCPCFRLKLDLISSLIPYRNIFFFLLITLRLALIKITSRSPF